ncbi:MAG: Ni/Fe-hydrogenase 1 b-type cytochrome subunit [Alphaproteobacteria bacterium]|nr:Ni/Fe-hydrogenase 1 b-type cytochrome subunit [Alphaproteobacteria bacterium]
MADKDASGLPGEPRAVWDLAIRLFHWMLVILFCVSWAAAKYRYMTIHLWSGYTVLSLILFRILWGLVGSSTARFAGFVRGPAAILAYGRSFPSRARNPHLGHNPMGALSVVAMLTAFLAHTSFGLFAVDVDGIDSGPLARFVSFDVGREASRLHGITFTLIQLLVALHVLVILFYLVYKRDNLIVRMFTGRARFPATFDPPAARLRSLWLALVLFAATSALVWLVIANPPRF